MSAMASPALERAPQVCNTCRMRKKACDKQLPYCSYCTKRGIRCSYDDDASTSRGSTTIWDIDLNQAVTPLHMGLQCDPFCGQMTLDRKLNLQVGCIMQSLNLSFFDISDRFFQDFHLWFPVISPTLFYEHGTFTSPLSADFLVLLLAMCLVTQNAAVDTLYMSLKVLFAQAQAAICSSATLVQAGLLISTYEYTRGWLDAAYISIGNCVRMAHIIRIDNNQRDKIDHDIWLRRSAHENWNIWYGVVVLERSVD